MNDAQVIVPLKRLGLVMLGGILVFSTLLGLADLMLGYVWGLQHFAVCLPILLLMYAAWHRPGLGGWALLGLGLLSSAFFFLSMIQPQDKIRAALLMSAPLYGAGLLFLVAAWIGQLSKKTV
jgi:hypothetical protein